MVFCQSCWCRARMWTYPPPLWPQRRETVPSCFVVNFSITWVVRPALQRPMEMGLRRGCAVISSPRDGAVVDEPPSKSILSSSMTVSVGPTAYQSPSRAPAGGAGTRWVPALATVSTEENSSPAGEPAGGRPATRRTDRAAAAKVFMSHTFVRRASGAEDVMPIINRGGLGVASRSERNEC